MKKTILGSLALAAVFSAAALLNTGCGGASDVTVIKFSHTQNPGSVSDLTALEFKKYVEEASGGKMRVDIFSNCGLSGGDLTKAIELTQTNVALNFPGDNRHKAFCEDAFKYLDAADGKYDLIILDPPAFAKHRAALHNALKGYTRLNMKAFERIKSGGILFTFSCSQVVTKDNFRNAVFTAAALAKRNVRILHQLHQPADHPINIYHPEGEYLKGLVLYVE